jgi:hypothetical protein
VSQDGCSVPALMPAAVSVADRAAAARTRRGEGAGGAADSRRCYRRRVGCVAATSRKRGM